MVHHAGFVDASHRHPCGTGLVNSRSASETASVLAVSDKKEPQNHSLMKNVSKKLLFSIIAVTLLAPISATALIVGARVAEVTQGNGNDLLLVALAFAGAALSALNGLGRRTAGLNRAAGHSKKLSRQQRAVVQLN